MLNKQQWLNSLYRKDLIQLWSLGQEGTSSNKPLLRFVLFAFFFSSKPCPNIFIFFSYRRARDTSGLLKLQKICLPFQIPKKVLSFLNFLSHIDLLIGDLLQQVKWGPGGSGWGFQKIDIETLHSCLQHKGCRYKLSCLYLLKFVFRIRCTLHGARRYRKGK